MLECLAILRELAGSATAQDPVRIDPGHYTVEVDNDRVRALRVHYGPGEGSSMHAIRRASELR
jgi:hypothetical protein